MPTILISASSSSGPTILMISPAVAGHEARRHRQASNDPQAKPLAAGAGCGRGQVVFAEWNHGARLRAPGALTFLDDKAHLVADFELIKAAIGDAVAVEIDFAAVGLGMKPQFCSGSEARNSAVVGHRMQLHVAASLTYMVFEQPTGRSNASRIATYVLMRVVRRGIAPDHDLAARDIQVDADLER